MQFAVEGKPAGSRIAMKAGGGTVDATWQVASVTVPMTKGGADRERRGAREPQRETGPGCRSMEAAN
jgi:hypothetical protein